MNWTGTPLPPDELKKAWRNFRRRRKNPRSQPARKLILHYLGLVKAVAKIFSKGKPPILDFDDLASAGYDGLRAAIEMFDLKRGVKFETYCGARIKGAILDALRNSDWVPRQVRHRATQLTQSRHKLENVLGRAPTHHELAQFMGLSEKEFERLRRDAIAVGVFSLDRKFTSSDSSRDIREADLMADRRAEDPTHPMQAADLRNYLLRGLTRNSRRVLLLYYADGLWMSEIAAVLNISEARISQLHARAITFLRSRFPKPNTDDNLPPTGGKNLKRKI
ncbi:MAG TPA: FliA/WhiG family RNA polymerase sigma factor [Phycisphaerae bacterium]|nr:FliA/WhiG family RNA polymerase sigma factor [Phycisphaerae bacterium]